MSRVEIRGEQHSVGEIFSERYAFVVPPYQRQYAWKQEHAGELLDDLLQALGEGDAPLDEQDPYFLGSIVLIERGRQEYEIVDGQQRLITLTILLAVLRALIPAEYQESITHRLYEPADPLNNIPARYRLRPKTRDEDFFRTFIQSEGGIERLRGQLHVQLSEGQLNMRDNARLCWDELAKLPEERRVRLAQFVMQRCLLVVISTPEMSSAYRIFSVLNTRGVDLTDADILKADVVGTIPPDEQHEYTHRWEHMEEALGARHFSDLLGHVRTIEVRSWKQTRMLEDFRTQVVGRNGDNRRLISDVLEPMSSAYFVMLNCSYEHEDARLAGKIDELLHWLQQIENRLWVPPTLLYFKRNHSKPERLAAFLRSLERLAASLMIRRQYAHRLEPRYNALMDAIAAGADLSRPHSPIQLSKEECDATLLALDGDLYTMAATPRNYVLRRLDSDLAERAATYDERVFTVEHVLPRTPARGSEWMTWFPTPELQARWVHRLGNLALLTRQKNANASNYDFATKKRVYFAARNGVSPYALTTQVLREEVWTPEVVERRQRELVGRLRKLWDLDRVNGI
jgi:Protein of unknown function DUF262/Protein of unknown function (DUF1524)